MTLDASQASTTENGSGTLDPAAFGLPVVADAEIPAELHELVAGMRRLVDVVAHTGAPPERLAHASTIVTELADQLDMDRREIGTMLRRDYPDASAEYGTVTNVVTGITNPAAPPLELKRHEAGEETPAGVSAAITLGGVYQGPPGLVHGGWISAMLDQALGEAASAAGMPGLTAHLEADYPNPTPLFTPLTIRAWVTGSERRKVFVRAEIRNGDQVTARGSAIMVQILPTLAAGGDATQRST
ncbi:PaaI family thioesterase [Lipingzhangella sp. LS1_29]|uniref:Acyl-coenzyme A thioesterase THEM4 n=1 Tax=Lipingzhangella rawalii TaxID=2055835 RepID=A0ABU2H309_9ACTN|nr:PaaI family thioesterase [Lipingzhangella rawalii]MDS1269372.1 PaaI family thioesterase [Lipingzhangella rawalii]